MVEIRRCYGHLAVVQLDGYGGTAVVVGVLLRAEVVGLLDVLLEYELLNKNTDQMLYEHDMEQ